MSELTDSKLIKLMRAHESILALARVDFLSNEINYKENLDLCLQKKYYEIEPVYTEIMRRFSKPEVKIFQSKMNLEEKSLELRGYSWQSSL